MRLLRNIINIIYSTYCIVLFFIFLLLLMCVYAAVYFLDDRRRTLIAYRANRALMTLWFPLCGLKLKIEGAEKIDRARTYMFVCNHNNMLDMHITGYVVQHYYKTLIKKELQYVPVLGFLMRVIAIPVDRSNAESRRRSTQKIVDLLNSGVSFFIFPEGTRNTTGQPLKSFYSGAFKTAIMAQVPVLPIVYLDYRHLQPVGTFRVHPGTIRVKVLDAIETKGMSTENAGELQDRVHKLMEAVILSEDKEFNGTGGVK